jgi:ACR3 family arsenite efflux pump ArsB
MKMLSWELPFVKVLSGIRRQEAQQVRKMARIRAVNMALNFAITPIVAFSTFAVYRYELVYQEYCGLFAGLLP